jgi:diaminopimelate decarboxylase
MAQTQTLPAAWPQGTRVNDAGCLEVGGCDLVELAREFGTPAFVVAEDDLRARAQAFTHALRARFRPSDVVFASKSFPATAVMRVFAEEGLSCDAATGGELHLALGAGFTADRIVLHGNAKSPRDLRTALRLGVGRIVVDSGCEIARIATQVPGPDPQRVLVRVLPGIEAGAHPKVRTGAEGQKFGLSIADGDAADAVARILGRPSLELVGLHCHLGSQIDSVEPYELAARTLVSELARIRDTHHVVLPELDLGGGHGIAYLPGKEGLSPERFADSVLTAITERAAGLGLPVPRLIVEPGRAIVGTAGTTLYRVVAVKQGGSRTFVAVDGGMSDNPRPALYGARYAVRLAGRVSREGPRSFTIVGHHCETGDTIAEDVQLPADLRPGDLVALAATGAYHHSMASTYNLMGRPPVVAVHNNRARLVVRREVETR